MVRSDPHPSPQEQFRAPWKAEGWVGRGEGETGWFTCREPALGSLSSRFTCAAIAVGAGGGLTGPIPQVRTLRPGDGALTHWMAEPESAGCLTPSDGSFFFFSNISLFIWLRQVLVAARGIFSCGMWPTV